MSRSESSGLFLMSQASKPSTLTNFTGGCHSLIPSKSSSVTHVFCFFLQFSGPLWCYEWQKLHGLISHVNTCVLLSWELKFHLKKVKMGHLQHLEILWGSWSENSWVPGLWDLMANDLRWSWCNNHRNKMHNECNVLESPPNRLLCLLHGNVSSAVQ